jgi:hypothetical protein
MCGGWRLASFLTFRWCFLFLLCGKEVTRIRLLPMSVAREIRAIGPDAGGALILLRRLGGWGCECHMAGATTGDENGLKEE